MSEAAKQVKAFILRPTYFFVETDYFFVFPIESLSLANIHVLPSQ